MNLPSLFGKYSGGGGGGMGGFDDGGCSKCANGGEFGMDDNGDDWSQAADVGEGSDDMDGGSMVYGSMTKRQEGGDGGGIDADSDGWSKYGSSTGNTTWKSPSLSSSSYGSDSSYGSATSYGGSVTKHTTIGGGAGVGGYKAVLSILEWRNWWRACSGFEFTSECDPSPDHLSTLVYPDGAMTLMPPDGGAAAAASVDGDEGPRQ